MIISVDKIRSYLKSSPGSRRLVLSPGSARSYYFFKLAPLPEDPEPYGTAKESLVPQRSVRVDPSIFPASAAFSFFQNDLPLEPTATVSSGDCCTRALSRWAWTTGGAIKGRRRHRYLRRLRRPSQTTMAHSQWKTRAGSTS